MAWAQSAGPQRCIAGPTHDKEPETSEAVQVSPILEREPPL